MIVARQFAPILSLVLLTMSFAALEPQAAHAEENWPQFRGPNGDGHTDAKNLPTKWSETENIAWKTPIHDRGWSSPVVWGNQIWLTTATPDGLQMFAICVDLATGKIIHDIKLFENEKPDEIHALNSYASPTPVIEEGRVYVSFGSYGLACLDTNDGKVLWQRRDLPCKHHRGPGSSPILDGNLLIEHYDGFDVQYVVALDKRTGETVWKSDRTIDYGADDGDIKKAYSTPTIVDVAGRAEMISPTSKATVALDPKTGEELWRVRYKEFSATARPVVGKGLVLISTGFGKANLVAIRPDGAGDVTDTHVAWVATKGVPSKPSLLVVEGLINMVSDNGVATCLSLDDGKEVWSKRLGGNYSASPLAAPGRIYFFSQEGKTSVIEPGDSYKELAENELESGFMASPAVSGKALILRTEKALYRIENK